MTTPPIKQQDAQALAQGYSRAYRAVEIVSIITFFAMMVAICIKTAPHAQKSPWLVAAAFMVGYLLADFTSGFVHWLADTWGSTEMPVLGKTLLRPFREHHVDQKAMTHHDYIETNGSNCLISIPWAIGALATPLDVPGWHDAALFFMVSISSMIFWVMMTNQFHKWSHMDPAQLPNLVVWLQKRHFILPVDHHQIHHQAPYLTHYCITTGWLNVPLQKLAFFRTLERLGTFVFGAIPRKDDIGLAAALATAPAPLEPASRAEHQAPHA